MPVSTHLVAWQREGKMISHGTPSGDIARFALEAWDAIVVGAGPAGSIAARQIARAGKRVLLVDKAAFPRRKVCGGCLNAAALDTLARAGLAELSPRVGAEPLNRLSIHCGGKSTIIPLLGNVAVARDRFDAALAAEAAAAGATFVSGVEARPDGQDDNCRWVQLSSSGVQHRVRAKMVVVAAGLNGWRELDPKDRRSPEVDSRVGAGAILTDFPEALEPGVVSMSVAAGGYVGMVRLAAGQLDVAAAFDKKFLARAGSPAAAAMQILASAGTLYPDQLLNAAWFGTPALTHRLSHVATSRTFFVGDAAGYVEPFTGEGMAWALESACAAAPLVLRAVDDYQPTICHEWEAVHRRLLARRMLVCRAVGRLLRYPRLTRIATTVVARAPWIAQPIVRAINQPIHQ